MQTVRFLKKQKLDKKGQSQVVLRNPFLLDFICLQLNFSDYQKEKTHF